MATDYVTQNVPEKKQSTLSSLIETYKGLLPEVTSQTDTSSIDNYMEQIKENRDQLQGRVDQFNQPDKGQKIIDKAGAIGNAIGYLVDKTSGNRERRQGADAQLQKNRDQFFAEKQRGIALRRQKLQEDMERSNIMNSFNEKLFNLEAGKANIKRGDEAKGQTTALSLAQSDSANKSRTNAARITADAKYDRYQVEDQRKAVAQKNLDNTTGGYSGLSTVNAVSLRTILGVDKDWGTMSREEHDAEVSKLAREDIQDKVAFYYKGWDSIDLKSSKEKQVVTDPNTGEEHLISEYDQVIANITAETMDYYDKTYPLEIDVINQRNKEIKDLKKIEEILEQQRKTNRSSRSSDLDKEKSDPSAFITAEKPFDLVAGADVASEEEARQLSPEDFQVATDAYIPVDETDRVKKRTAALKKARKEIQEKKDKVAAKQKEKELADITFNNILKGKRKEKADSSQSRILESFINR